MKTKLADFQVCISDHGVKETCAIMSTQVTDETDHNFLLCDSMMPSVPNFCFLCILL